MISYTDKLAVITGAGTGIGRGLARHLSAEGCHLALCDINPETLESTVTECKAQGVNVLSGLCDVGIEADILAFRDEVARHTDHIHLLFNNAGISGGSSFVSTSREEWERIFDICWFGVYHTTRAFLPMLLKSDAGHVINMSSANGLRAVLGGHYPHTAYSTAKFAVRGFTESLIHDFRFNAPHLQASVVFPGTIGTDIVANSAKVLGHNPPAQWTEEDIAIARRRWEISGADVSADMSDADVRARGEEEIDFLHEVGVPPDDAARQILDCVRAGDWRIIVGPDCETLDELVRTDPGGTYDEDFVLRWREATAKIMS